MKLHDIVPAAQPATTVTDPSHNQDDDGLSALLAQVDMPREPSEGDILRATLCKAAPASARDALADIPVVDMAGARRVADRLDLAIVPFSSLKDEAWSGEPATVQHQILGFEALARKAGLRVYALTPGIYFDCARYVARSGGARCYGGGKAAAFSAIHLTAEMLAAMQGQIGDVRADVAALDARQAEDFATTTRAVRAVEQRLGAVEQAMQRASGEEASMEASRRAAVQRARGAVPALRPIDPMLIAIAGDDPTTARVALAGPCWGPDISPEMLRRLR